MLVVDNSSKDDCNVFATKTLGVAGDESLESQGWKRRCLADPPRAQEMKELYESMGLEVYFQEPQSAQFGDKCKSCASGCATHVLVYTRDPNKLSS